MPPRPALALPAMLLLALLAAAAPRTGAAESAGAPAAGSARATPSDAERAGAQLPPIDPALETRLRERGTPELIEEWRRAKAVFETAYVGQEDDDPMASIAGFEEAARRYETLAERTPGMGDAWWRSARAWWLAAETYPVEQKEAREALFERSADLAGRGIEQDPRCAGCMLWRASAMGRLQTSRGMMSAMRTVPEMANLLESAIALEPTYADNADNSTLGNLHYASAILYRVLPDSIWLKWLMGVRGDRERALGHARVALQRHPKRLDYAVEVGAQLLCLGSLKDQPERLREGRTLLEVAKRRQPENEHELRQVLAADIMLAEPRKSCGFTGDAWVDIDEAMKQAKAAERAD